MGVRTELKRSLEISLVGAINISSHSLCIKGMLKRGEIHPPLS